MSTTIHFFSKIESAEPFFSRAVLHRSTDYSQRIEWIRAEWKCLKTLRFLGKAFGKKYRIVVAEESGTPLFLAPIYIKGSEAGIIGSESPTDIRDFTICDGCHPEAFFLFFEELRKLGVKKFILESVSKRSPTRLLLPEKEQISWELSAHNDPIVSPLESPQIWWASLKPKFRSNVEYAARRLEKSGLPHCIDVFDAPFPSTPLKRAMELHKRRVHQIQKNSVSVKKNKYKLLEVISRTGVQSPAVRFASEARLPGRLYVFWIDGKCAAATIGFESIDKTRLQIPFVCYENSFKDFSPGILLLRTLIETEMQNNVAVDFMLGDEKYKFDFGAVNNYFDRCVISIN